jgi:hypothetical protein
LSLREIFLGAAMVNVTFTLQPDRRDRFRDDPPYASEFHAAIGRIVIVWGKLERAIDIIAASARTIDSTHPIIEDPNFGLRRKIKAIRRALKGHTPFGKNQKWISGLLSAVRSAGKIRNLLIHGMFDGFSNEGEPKIKFNSSRYHPHGVKRENGEFSFSQLQNLNSEIQRIESEMGILLMGVVTAPRTPEKQPPRPRKSSRKAPRRQRTGR